MAELVKVTIPLPDDNLAGAATESVWAEPQGENKYIVKNIPFYAKGVSYDDLISANPRDGKLAFDRVLQHNGHSTYRVYASIGRTSPEVLNLLGRLRNLHCDIEPATDKLVGVDVLPGANIYHVYDELAKAEQSGIVDFDEGHCGHALRS